MSQKINHLDALSVVQIDFNIWSGQTKLRPEDVKLGVGGELPSEKVAQLGSKRVIDTANLKGFHRLKQEARRMLSRYGMPFMNGYAIPVDKTSEVCARLDNVEQEFNQLKQAFVQDYNEAIDQWARENPEFSQAIREGALSQSDVESRIGFEYQLFRIAPIGDGENADRLSKKVNSLGDDLISEVVKTASDFYNTNLLGKTHVNISTRRTLMGIRDKLDGLSFLNGALTPLVQLLDGIITGYADNAEGRHITEPFIWKVIGAVLIMSDRNRIEQYASGKVTVDAVGNLAKKDDEKIRARHMPSRVPADAIAHELAMRTDEADDESASEPKQGQAPAAVSGDTDPAASQAVLADIDAFFASARSAETHRKSQSSVPEKQITPVANENAPAMNQQKTESGHEQHLPVDTSESSFFF